MDIHQARIPPVLPFGSVTRPLNKQAYVLQKIFNAHVSGYHGRFLFRDGAWGRAFEKKRRTSALNDAQKNAVEAIRPFVESTGASIGLESGLDAGLEDYTAYAFLCLLYALYVGRLYNKITAENCAKQLGWLSQVPSQAENIFKHTYDAKWDALIKAFHETIFFAGDGTGAALANESARLIGGFAACKVIPIREASSALSNHANSLLTAFVLSRADCSWAMPLLALAKEKGLRAAAVTMHSLQAEVLPHADACLPFPNVEPIAIPILGIMPMQIFANDMALSKGLQAHSLLQ